MTGRERHPGVTNGRAAHTLQELLAHAGAAGYVAALALQTYGLPRLVVGDEDAPLAEGGVGTLAARPSDTVSSRGTLDGLGMAEPSGAAEENKEGEAGWELASS